MTQSGTPKKNIILYADDDGDDLELVQDAFSRYAKNVDVVTVTDGSQALNYLYRLGPQDPKPCLLILDINMPVINGKEVLKRIRENEIFEFLPVVLFTTSSLPQDQAFAQKNRAAFLTKPLDVSQMELIIELFIDQCKNDIQKDIRNPHR